MAIDALIDELERKYRETQERMSDPAVYNDHREAADTGRRLKELEGPYKLAQRWREVMRDLEDAKDDPELSDLLQDLGLEAERLESDLKLALVKTEPLGGSPNEFGGIKEMTIAVKGEGAYSVFKWEGGTHRVQRVPETESQGRIHTSTATVAVMPEAEDVEVEIDPNDLKIDVYRSTGPGGQSVNTTDSAVRITHVPTGVVVAM